MNTVEIYTFLYNLMGGRRVYFNVLAADELVLVPQLIYPQYIVVNNKPASHGGQHCVAIYIRSRSSPIEFFDSYGLGLRSYDENFTNFAHRHGKLVVENVRRLKNHGSDVCGHYSLYFLYKRFRGCSLMSIYAKFSTNYRLNDEKVRQFVKIKKNLLRRNCKYKNKILQTCTNF
jgi:hypothetical protein